MSCWRWKLLAWATPVQAQPSKASSTKANGALPPRVLPGLQGLGSSRVKSRSGRDSNAQENQDLSVTGCDGVTSTEEREDTASCDVDRGRSEPSHADAIGAALASAMLAWCNDRDPKAMRRVLLELLLALDEK
jgi:hypothetical protein